MWLIFVLPGRMRDDNMISIPVTQLDILLLCNQWAPREPQGGGAGSAGRA